MAHIEVPPSASNCSESDYLNKEVIYIYIFNINTL